MTDSLEATILRISARATEFWLFRTFTSKEWSCHIKWENSETKLEIRKSNHNMATAFHQAVEAFDEIASNGIPQLSLPPTVDGDFIETTQNDEIPF